MRLYAIGMAVIMAGYGTTPAAAACKPVRAASDIAGIRIADGPSATKIIGAGDRPGFPATEQEKDADGVDLFPPNIRFASRDGREELKLFHHYGDSADAYNEIEVLPAAGGKPGKAKRLALAHFATGSGIRLGMAQSALTQLLGTCFQDQAANRGVTTLHYAITDEQHPLLKRSGMPSYYADYDFSGARLVRFKFGFEYP